MRYTEFKIYNYKGITSPVTINIGKDNQLIPIIGVNECGKTTILEAIYAFGFYYGIHFSDNEKYVRYILNSYNCFNPLGFNYPDPIKISAKIAFDEENLPYTLSQFIKKIMGEDFINKNPQCNLEEHNTLTIMKCVHKNYFNEIGLNGNQATDAEVFEQNLMDNMNVIHNRIFTSHRKDFSNADFLEDIYNKLQDIFDRIQASKSEISYTIEDDWVKYLTSEQKNKINSCIGWHLPQIVYFDDFSYSIPPNNETIPLEGNSLISSFELSQKKKLESCAPLKKEKKLSQILQRENWI